MPTLYNLARMTTATTGTGTMTLGSAATVNGVLYLTFAQAGVPDGATVTYAIADPVGGASEIGRGVYTSAGTTLTRATILNSTNSNNAINLSGFAQVFITAAGQDINNEAVNAQTGTTYTMLDLDRAKLVTFSNTSSVAVTLPQAGASSIFASGWFSDLRNLNRGAVTITPTTSTINGASTLVLQRGQQVRVVSDGTNYQIAPGFGIKVVTQVFTASGTYTPTSGMVYCVIEAVGGGGGAGGSTGEAGNIFVGGGGGSGSYSRLTATAATIGASQVVTIGAGGAGGASGSNNGSAGGDTSLGSLCIGKGGGAGLYGSVSQIGRGGAAGVAGTGDVVPAGNPGHAGFYNDVSTAIVISGGGGGDSAFGGGGREIATGAGATNGENGGAYGGGGSGGGTNDTTSGASGGNGAAGVIVVTEFCIS